MDGLAKGGILGGYGRERPGSTLRKGLQIAFAFGVLVIGLLLPVSASSKAARQMEPPPNGPHLLVDGSVSPDLRALAEETWQRFVSAMGPRARCFGDVHLHAVGLLDARAEYDPVTMTATVQVPASAAMLESALVHEWAHHVEYQCPAHRELRSAFLAAMGMPPDTAWRPGPTAAVDSGETWAKIPSEECAEAVVEFVLGRRPIPTGAKVTPDGIAAVARWAGR